VRRAKGDFLVGLAHAIVTDLQSGVTRRRLPHFIPASSPGHQLATLGSGGFSQANPRTLVIDAMSSNREATTREACGATPGACSFAQMAVWGRTALVIGSAGT
jgi:hypothetical protein